MRLLSICFLTTLAAAAQTYDYDAAGRVIRVAYPGGGGLTYTYDDSDNLTRVLTLNLSAAPSGLQLTSKNGGDFQLDWSAVSQAREYVVMRSVAGSGQWQEIARVTAPAASYTDRPAAGQTYLYRIAAVTAAGVSAYSDEVSTGNRDTLDPRSGRKMPLSAGGASRIATKGTGTETLDGYAKVTVDSGDAPYGLVVFRLRQNGVTVGETGVPATPPTRGTRIFVEFRRGVSASAGQYAGTVDVNTGIAMVNPNDTPVPFQLTLRDGDGRVVSTGAGIMAAGQHTARLLSDFQALAADFRLPADFEQRGGYGTLDITGDAPLSVLALRLSTNQRGELLFSTTRVTDLQALPPTGPAYLAHVPEGGGFNSKISLVSTAAGPQTGLLRLLSDDGAPFPIRTTAGTTASEFAYQISPGGAFVIESDGSSPGVRAGWLQVIPTAGESTPAVSGTFRFGQNGFLSTEAGIPGAELTTRARVYVDTTGGHNTGIALANPGGAATAIRARAFALDGTTETGQPGEAAALAPQGHTAREAGRFITGLPPEFVGLLELEADTPFLALTVRSLSNERGELLFTTFPVADQTKPAPSPIVFPHLADGGGFRTELILISPGGASRATVRLFDSVGQPFAGLE